MLIYAYKMILVAPSLTLSEQKLVLYFIFCFDVDDTSKYIYRSILYQERIDRVNNEANIHKSNLLLLVRPKLQLPF